MTEGKVTRGKKWWIDFRRIWMFKRKYYCCMRRN